MSKILNEADWPLHQLVPGTALDVTLHLTNPPLDVLRPMLPKARLVFGNQFRKQHLEQLKALGLLRACVPFPDTRQPRGATGSVSVEQLQQLAKLPFVESLWINGIQSVQSRKRRKRPARSFHCVQTTVAVQIEGETQELQLYEQRWLLIKAASCEDAREKVRNASRTYAEPYLNSDGKLVRWQLESVDDCYETGLTKLSELDNPDGAEVFSILKRRRLTSDRM
ncbi:DUF4288 domain-containing protein [Hymenobacter pini]|uniref:DUF4288 domain-containing protein n=1 Tax=Hymenobacter pini TaxID=2880879 RepID=UPI001CF12023|nr:DUF4288 domain-containing protein [Hymenobacter pini]MCA8829021.1 DUF4288 domain-containing protein [Hymenobacter pini]